MNNLPLKYLRSSALWPAVALLIALNLWLGIKAGGDRLLTNTVATQGIVSLETAGSAERAGAIILSWTKTPDGISLRSVALHSLIYDGFFIIFYTITLALGCFIAAGIIEVRHRKLKDLGLVKLGLILARLQVLTAALDFLEDIALWRMLSNSTSSLWPSLARWCAIPKFALIAVSLLYILLAFIFRLGESHQRRPSRQRQASGT
jgi:hypothetical protein